jgi:hypothetical protein
VDPDREHGAAGLTAFQAPEQNRRTDAACVIVECNAVNVINRTLPALLALALCSLGAFAHHSTANFDRTKEATITGKVTYFGFTNPHSFIDLDVTDAATGKVAPHKVFLPGRVLLTRYNWKPGDLKVGDVVTLSGAPDRKDPTFIYMTRIKFAGGKSWVRSEQIPE